MPQKVLLATDGSKDAALAARAAVDVCERTGAQLHARFPALTIVVGHWGETALTAENLALLRADGIEQVGTTLRETRDQVMQVSQRLASLIPHAVPRMS